MKVPEDFFPLGAPIGHCPHKGFKRYGLIARKELSLEYGGIVIIEYESPLPAELDDILWPCKVLFGEPKLFDGDLLYFQVVGDLGEYGLVDLYCDPLGASAVHAILVLFVEHFLFLLWGV